MARDQALIFFLRDGTPNMRDVQLAFAANMGIIAVIGDWRFLDDAGRRIDPVDGDPDLEGGEIPVPEGDCPIELSNAIRRYFPRDAWWNAARVSFYESGWYQYAENDTTWRANGRCNVGYYYSEIDRWAVTEQSYGYFQINACVHGGDANHWFDRDNNVAKAADLYNNDGWSAWAYTASRLGI